MQTSSSISRLGLALYTAQTSEHFGNNAKAKILYTLYTYRSGEGLKRGKPIYVYIYIANHIFFPTALLPSGY